MGTKIYNGAVQVRRFYGGKTRGVCYSLVVPGGVIELDRRHYLDLLGDLAHLVTLEPLSQEAGVTHCKRCGVVVPHGSIHLGWGDEARARRIQASYPSAAITLCGDPLSDSDLVLAEVPNAG